VVRHGPLYGASRGQYFFSVIYVLHPRESVLDSCLLAAVRSQHDGRRSPDCRAAMRCSTAAPESRSQQWAVDDRVSALR
jgi:hypothetical protein